MVDPSRVSMPFSREDPKVQSDIGWEDGKH
jgi:hypothetical protein